MPFSGKGGDGRPAFYIDDELFMHGATVYIYIYSGLYIYVSVACLGFFYMPFTFIIYRIPTHPVLAFLPVY